MPVFFCASIMLFWLLEFCNIALNQKVWCLQVYFLSGLLWIFKSFCGSIQCYEFLLYFVQKAIIILRSIAFIFLCCFEWHFNNTTFFQSMSMEYLFTYLCLLQYLSLLFYSFQCTCFSLLIKFIPWYFILFDTIVNGI